MSRESLRRFGAVNFEKSQLEQLVETSQRDTLLREAAFFRGLLETALKSADLKAGDDFSLRLVVTERLPEDRS